MIGTARVVTYEDLEEERAKRAVMDAETAEKKVKKAAKEARNVASVVTEVEGAAKDTNKRGRKRKNTASGTGAATPKAKVARTSKIQVTEGEQDIGAPEPRETTVVTVTPTVSPQPSISLPFPQTHRLLHRSKADPPPLDSMYVFPN